MQLLGRESITVQPKKQTLAAGVYVLSNNGASSTVWGSVQPIGQRVLERLPEGVRASARWQVWVESPTTAAIFIGGNPGTVPDQLTTSVGTLIPIAEIDYLAHASGLPHVSYACAEAGGDE